jgi:hypothetical protein
MAGKVQPVEVATGAFSKTIENAGMIARIGWAPFAAAWLIAVVGSFVGGGISMLVAQLATALAFAVVSVPLFRKFLLDETPPNEPYYFKFEQREQKMAIVYVAFSLAYMVPAWLSMPSGGVPSAGGSLLGLILSLAIIFAAVRLTLIFPSVALDKPTDLGPLFAKTEGNFWRIFASGILVAIPLMIIFMILGIVGVGGMAISGGAVGPIGLLFGMLVSLIGIGIGTAMMAGIYQNLEGAGNASPTEALPES